MSENEISIHPNQEKKDFKVFQHEVDGDLVTLKYKEFLPSDNRKIPEDKAIFYFPGWGTSEEDYSYDMEKLLANRFKLKTIFF